MHSSNNSVSRHRCSQLVQIKPKSKRITKQHSIFTVRRLINSKFFNRTNLARICSKFIEIRWWSWYKKQKRSKKGLINNNLHHRSSNPSNNKSLHPPSSNLTSINYPKHTLSKCSNKPSNYTPLGSGKPPSSNIRRLSNFSWSWGKARLTRQS